LFFKASLKEQCSFFYFVSVAKHIVGSILSDFVCFEYPNVEFSWIGYGVFGIRMLSFTLN